MQKIRRGDERGHANHGWLDTYHTFSFASYYDPRFMGFRTLRVINEDKIDGGSGFGAHSHSDMEILTYVIGGTLEHKDSMGNRSIIGKGEVQRMSAGRGITHSEYNHSPSDSAHFLQIWIEPEALGIEPGYEQRDFSGPEGRGLSLVASPNGDEGSMKIHQDVRLHLGNFCAGDVLNQTIRENRHIWIQMVNGALEIGGHPVWVGDGVAISGERSLAMRFLENTEFLLFDLA